VKARATPRNTPELGLREQNKRQTRQRIQAAVRELFSKHGYDDATLRGIAKRAHVGLGTLFNYAGDKRDLVFLIVNEELEEVTGKALSAAKLYRSLMGQLMAIFRCHYDYFAKIRFCPGSFCGNWYFIRPASKRRSFTRFASA